MDINGQASLRPIYKTFFFNFTHLNVLSVCDIYISLESLGPGRTEEGICSPDLEVKCLWATICIQGSSLGLECEQTVLLTKKPFL